MGLHYEELDERLLSIINSFRVKTLNTRGYDLYVIKQSFIYKNNNYFLVSLMPELSCVQLLVELGFDGKVKNAYIIVGMYMMSISKKEAEREISNIRKYNSKISSTRCENIPKYFTTLDNKYLNVISSMYNSYMMKKNMEYIKDGYKDICYIYDDYIKLCLNIDEQREKPKVFKYKKLLK